MKRIILASVIGLLTYTQSFAALNGAIRINSDTTGTNTKSSAITVDAQTNLLAGTITLTNLGAAKIPVTDSAGKLVAATNTGSGSIVMSSSPTIASPTVTGTATFADMSITTLAVSGKITQPVDAIAALEVDWSAGNTLSKTIGSNSTFTFANATAGQWITVKVTASGSFTATWPTVTWKGGAAPTQTASKTDFYTFFYDGTTYYGSASQNY